MSLLLNLWRDIGTHLELPDAIAQMLPRLAKLLPVSALAICRLEPALGRAENAAWSLTDGLQVKRSNREISVESIQRLSLWCCKREIVQGLDQIKQLDLVALLPAALENARVVMAGLCGHAVGEPAQSDNVGALIVASAEQKPFSAQQISIIEQLIEPLAAALVNDHRVRELKSLREAVEAENRALLSRLHRESVADTIVGAEAGLADVMERVELVSKSEAPVLIFGETGTGKEVLARAIHNRSKRSQGPMMRVNCGAIPAELVDSELFGHERGSFTGASATRKGWFERADGGTLFLDEIGELPLAAQVRLLRVLQDGTFERVGGQITLTVNVRLIAATHADLYAMVRQHLFRDDLWYRISVFPIHLPPLRQRIEDIPALASHFAFKSARRLGLPPALPTQSDFALLTAYNWPGNVRELGSVIERAAILGNGHTLQIAKALGIAAPTAPVPQSANSISEKSPVQSLNVINSAHIEKTLQSCHGRIEGPFGAAKLLGINPHTLRSRMRKLGINWRNYRRRREGQQKPANE
jgi:hydrogenase-4 transcriptional activator